MREAAFVLKYGEDIIDQEVLHSSLDYVPPNALEQKWHLAKSHPNHTAPTLLT